MSLRTFSDFEEGSTDIVNQHTKREGCNRTGSKTRLQGPSKTWNFKSKIICGKNRNCKAISWRLSHSRNQER